MSFVDNPHQTIAENNLVVTSYLDLPVYINVILSFQGTLPSSHIYLNTSEEQIGINGEYMISIKNNSSLIDNNMSLSIVKNDAIGIINVVDDSYNTIIEIPDDSTDEEALDIINNFKISTNENKSVYFKVNTTIIGANYRFYTELNLAYISQIDYRFDETDFVGTKEAIYMIKNNIENFEITFRNNAGSFTGIEINNITYDFSKFGNYIMGIECNTSMDNEVGVLTLILRNFSDGLINNGIKVY